MRDDEPTIADVRDNVRAHDLARRDGDCEWCDDKLECWGSRVQRALLRRMEAEAETPSEAEAREAYVFALLEWHDASLDRLTMDEELHLLRRRVDAALSAYRAAVLRAAEAVHSCDDACQRPACVEARETVALVERARAALGHYECGPECTSPLCVLRRDADAWLARRAK